MKAYASKYELEFLSGNFFSCDLPESKRYLFKYFRTAIQKQFLRYFFVFGDSELFMQHSGFHCDDSYLEKMRKKYLKIERIYDEAFKKMDMMKLGQIKSGKLKFGKNE